MSAREGVGYVPFLPMGLLRLSFRLPKPESGDPVSIGDHVRKRRYELGLSQREAAAAIGICRDALARWESAGKSPDLRIIPAVIRFLGYDPSPEPASFPDRLARARKALGLSQIQFADRLGVPAPTLRAWEARLYAPPAARQAQIEASIRALTA